MFNVSILKAGFSLITVYDRRLKKLNAIKFVDRVSAVKRESEE